MNASGPEQKPPIVEGEYLAPEQHPASGRNWRATGGTLAVLAALAAKFKVLLIGLLNVKWILFASKFGLSAFSFLASIWFYALLFGPKFGVAFVFMLLLHEGGHALFARGYGLRVPGIYFIPGLGAFTQFAGELTPYRTASVALGGPFFGAIGAGVCFFYGMLTNEPFWYAIASTTFFLNLFNMIPLGLFDGGRITEAISPKFWIAGLVIVAALVIGFRFWSPILILVLLFSIPKTIAAWRAMGTDQPSSITPAEKSKITFAYFGLVAALAAGLALSHAGVPAANHPIFTS